MARQQLTPLVLWLHMAHSSLTGSYHLPFIQLEGKAWDNILYIWVLFISIFAKWKQNLKCFHEQQLRDSCSWFFLRMLLVYVSFNFPNLFVFLDLQLLFWYFSHSSNRDMSGPQGPIELWCKARRHTCKLPGLMASLQRGLYQLRETAYKRGLGENKNFFALFIVSLWQDEKLQVSFAWVWTWNNPLKTLIVPLILPCKCFCGSCGLLLHMLGQTSINIHQNVSICVPLWMEETQKTQ